MINILGTVATTNKTRAKHWAGCTLNNPTEEDAALIVKMRELCDYYVFGKETGTNGTEHLQFMVCFKAQKTFVTVKKLLPKAHWEVKSKFSTMKDASDYCKKGEQSHDEWNELKQAGPHFGLNADVSEYGTLPLDQQKAGLKVIADNYADTLEKAKVGNIADISAEHQIRYYGTIKKIAADNKKMPENLHWEEGEQPNFWIWGPTRTGKSHKARAMLGDRFYPKIASNKWWDKYNGEEGVLIEDIDTSHQYQGYNLKIWADKYAFPVEIKNGADWIRPKVIIVTSNYSIKQVFPDPSIHLPLLERFKEINLTVRYKKPALDGKLPPKKATPPKKRKYDQPLKKPALYRQNASGEIVVNKARQKLIDEPLSKTQIIINDSSEEEVGCVQEIVISSDDNLSEEFIEPYYCKDCMHTVCMCDAYEMYSNSMGSESQDLFDM